MPAQFANPLLPVTSNLILLLDASDRNSYPGTGNTWFDLSGYEHNAIKTSDVNSPQWNSLGYFNFSAGVIGNNAQFIITNTPTLTNLTQQTVILIHTLQTKTLASGDTPWMALYSKKDPDQRIAVSINQTGPGSSLRYLHIETPTPFDSVVDLYTNYTGDKYYFTVARIGSSSSQGFLNGIQVSNAALTTTGNSQDITIGGDGNDEMFRGKMGVISLYNKALSDSEIVSLYNYYKLRFNYD